MNNNYPDNLQVKKIKFEGGQFVRIANLKLRDGVWVKNPKWDFWVSQVQYGFVISHYTFEVCKKCRRLVCTDRVQKSIGSKKRYHKCEVKINEN